jgi:hypothetical protein
MSSFNPEKPSRAANAVNAAILREAQNNGTPLNALLAEVRWDTLKLNGKDFCHAAQIEHKTLQRLEQKDTPIGFDLANRVLQFWRKRGVPDTTIERGAKLFASDTGDNVGRLLRRISLIVGIEEFETRTGMDHHNLSKITSRVAPYDLSRGRALIHQLFPEDPVTRERLGNEYTKTWRAQTKLFFAQLNAPAPMIDLHIAIREHGFSHSRVYDILLGNNVTKNLAHRFLHLQPVPWTVVEPLVSLFFHGDAVGAIRSSWTNSVTPLLLKKNFADGMLEGKTKFGLSNSLLAKALGIQKDGACPPSDKVSRSIRGDPSFFEEAPPAILAYMVTTGGKPATKLHGLYAIGLTQRLYRERAHHLSSSNPRIPKAILQLRLARECWGISEETLAAKMGPPYTARSVRLLEQGKTAASPEEIRALRASVFQLGEKRLEDTLTNLRTLLRRNKIEQKKLLTPTSVAELTASAATRLGGFHKLSQASRSDDRSMSPSDERTLSQIAKGIIVPTLPVVAQIAKGGDIPLSDEIRADWRLRYPAYLLKTLPRFASDIRSRAIRTIIAERYPSVRHCAREVFPDIPERRITYTLRALGLGKASNPSIAALAPILLERLLPLVSDNQQRFVNTLFSNGGSLPSTLEELEQSFPEPVTAEDAIGATRQELDDARQRRQRRIDRGALE